MALLLLLILLHSHCWPCSLSVAYLCHFVDPGRAQVEHTARICQYSYYEESGERLVRWCSSVSAYGKIIASSIVPTHAECFHVVSSHAGDHVSNVAGKIQSCTENARPESRERQQGIAVHQRQRSRVD